MFDCSKFGLFCGGMLYLGSLFYHYQKIELREVFKRKISFSLLSAPAAGLFVSSIFFLIRINTSNVRFCKTKEQLAPPFSNALFDNLCTKQKRRPLTGGSIAMHYIVALKLLLTKIYETDGIPWHIVQRFVIKTLI